MILVPYTYIEEEAPIPYQEKKEEGISPLYIYIYIYIEERRR